MTPVVFVFAKLPLYGQVKTRLARRLGPARALFWYRNQLRALVARLGRDRRFRAVVAITPDWAAGRPVLGVGTVPQGGGDLGDRMGRILNDRRIRVPVLIVGSDIPGLTADHVARAFGHLRRADLVIGPSSDGGYWAIGSRPGARPIPGLFESVRWSTEHTLADTLAGLPPGLVLDTGLPVLDDLDT